ncbi:threonylcarbamoyl-AMP synthase [Patescibacteria group bacterium]|nr:threonylcarbamoyl-AMP synthase [Patescibacteria group bacterium]MBU1449005.1 threonylcarbamoyl-AMP synthase [Patescibacteria group bacterium]MBU2612847.1 threonylcarbamoyl-AMP synthase [Patescibacteria group bacterium]
MKTLRTRDIGVAAKVAVSALKHGSIVAFPTETAYGLGCDPRDAKAVAKVFRIKGRSVSKALPLVAASVAQVRAVVDITGMNDKQRATVRTLMSRYWPGPLTLVLPIRFVVGAIHELPLRKVIAPRGEVAIRVSSSPFVHAMTAAFGFPVAATSANLSGEPECRSGQAVARAFRSRKHRPDLVIDMGALPRRLSSTIVRIREDGSVDVLRRGPVRIARA